MLLAGFGGFDPGAQHGGGFLAAAGDDLAQPIDQSTTTGQTAGATRATMNAPPNATAA